MRKMIINEYSPMFKYAWDLYKQTLDDLRSFSERAGIRKDKVYLPSTIGSKYTAYERWNFLIENVKYFEESRLVNLTEDVLTTAIELYTKDRLEDAHKHFNVRMSMMSVLLNNAPKEDRNNEIVDYIRKARGDGDE